MSKKEIRRINTVPDWIRETIAEFKVTSEETPAYQIVNPWGTDSAEIVPVQLKLEVAAEPTGTGPLATVLVKRADSEATSGAGVEYVKSFNAAEGGVEKAKEKHGEIKSKLEELASLAEGGDQAVAKEKTSEYFKKLKSERDSNDPSTDVGLRSLTKVAEGLDIVEKQGAYKVLISDSLLKEALKKYKQVEGSPLQQPEITYTTSSRPHCGAHNFIVSYWGKLNVSDGNIVRKAVLVDRIGDGTRFLIAGVPSDAYNKLCEFLTPDPSHYGIQYDGITGNWALNKEALKINRETIVFEEGDDALKEQYLDAVSKGEKRPEVASDEGEPTGESKEESMPFEEGMGEKTEPLAKGEEAPAEGGTEGLPDVDQLLKDIGGGQ